MREVDGFTERIRQFFQSGSALAADDIRQVAFHPQRGGYAETQVDALLEPTSRTTYFTNVASGSSDPAMTGKLEAFAKTAPASARGEVEKALATIRYRQQVVQKRLPDADRWIAAHAGH